MTNHTLKLTDREVLEFARTGLERHLHLKAKGYKCSTEDLLNVLLGVGVNVADRVLRTGHIPLLLVRAR